MLEPITSNCVCWNGWFLVITSIFITSSITSIASNSSIFTNLHVHTKLETTEHETVGQPENPFLLYAVFWCSIYCKRASKECGWCEDSINSDKVLAEWVFVYTPEIGLGFDLTAHWILAIQLIAFLIEVYKDVEELAQLTQGCLKSSQSFGSLA